MIDHPQFLLFILDSDVLQIKGVREGFFNLLGYTLMYAYEDPPPEHNYNFYVTAEEATLSRLGSVPVDIVRIGALRSKSTSFREDEGRQQGIFLRVRVEHDEVRLEGSKEGYLWLSWMIYQFLNQSIPQEQYSSMDWLDPESFGMLFERIDLIPQVES